MSTREQWSKLASKFMKPPKPKARVNLVQKPSARFDQLRPSKSAIERSKVAPSVFPYITGRNGWKNNKGEGDWKLRHRWQPNMRKWRVPVTIMGGHSGFEKKTMPFFWMHMNMKQMKTTEKAGGIEALLVG